MASGDAKIEDVAARGRESEKIPNQGKEKRSKSQSRAKDVMAEMERRLMRVELQIADHITSFEDMGQNSEEYQASVEELRNEVHSMGQRVAGLEASFGELRAEVLGTITTIAETVRETYQAELVGIKEELENLKGDMSLCKRAMANGDVIAASRVDVPRPKSYGGSRNAKELENFLWGLEQYFEASGIRDELAKVRTASLYLVDVAMLWWRRRQGDIARGTCTMESWGDFKKEIKKQFYPENAELEARSRLRRLAHKGEIREYVREFSELLLEIPDFPDKEALFAFLDGLQPWAKIELQRRGVQDLASALAIAEALIDYQESDMFLEEGEHIDHGGKQDHSSGDERPRSPRNGGSKAGKHVQKSVDNSISCFLCNGPHLVRTCPKRSKFAAMMSSEEERSTKNKEKVAEDLGTSRMGSMRLLGGMQRVKTSPLEKGDGEDLTSSSEGGGRSTSMEEESPYESDESRSDATSSKRGNRRRRRRQRKINDLETKALIDTGANDNFLDVKEARRLGITYDKGKGMLKTVNSEATPIYGVAHKVQMKLGEWRGEVDFQVVDMDDYPTVLGTEFMDGMDVIYMARSSTILLPGKLGTVAVPLIREDLELKPTQNEIHHEAATRTSRNRVGENVTGESSQGQCSSMRFAKGPENSRREEKHMEGRSTYEKILEESGTFIITI
ncbi:hypothetical protein LINPERPRIM_LOCUS42162 [Linum perenne]